MVRFLGGVCLWVSAVMLLLLPIVVAADYGGVLRWTHYVAALAAMLAVALATACLTRAEGWSNRRHMLLIPLLLWLGFAWLQTVSLPAAVVGVLSPGSVDAYTEWINPFVSSDQQLSSFPISIARHDSLHVCALLAILIGIVWASAALFHERGKVVLLLGAISLGAAFHAGIGIWRMVFPETEAWSIATETQITAFGAFVNRNNAALMLNLGLAFSLGLLAWRMTALSGLEVDDPTFELSDLLSLTSDRDSVAGLVGAVMCIAGLLVCGSRGGLVAACFGLLLAFGWMRQRRGFVSIPVIGTAIALSVALLLVPLDLDLESIRRLEVFSQQDTSTMLRDGRLLHWQDGLDAAWAHFPTGSGLSTYAYAYLPHQQTSPQAWFHHADNLWLELLTEQGMVGVILALSIIVIVVLALRRLAESPDPIDHGLRITGWYSLAAIIVSQLFDFGLITLGNLIIVAILLPAIVSRAGAVASVKPAATNLVITNRQRIGVGAVALLSIALMYMALPQLQYDAKVETLTRSIDATLENSEVNPDVLAELARQLTEAAGDDPSPTALQALSSLAYRRARLLEVVASNAISVETLQQQYRETSPSVKRLKWLNANNDDDDDTPGESAGEAAGDYELPFTLTTQSLAQLPLNPSARWTIVFLDFVPRDPKMTLAALNQLQRFYPNNPDMLVTIGQFAADSSQYEIASDALYSALSQEPNMTSSVMAIIDRHPVLNASTVLPKNPEILRKAVPHLLRDAAANQQILAVAMKGLRCETCSTKATRSRCEELSGDVAYALTFYQDAYDNYREALVYDASNANLRIKLITRLREQGNRREAFQQARQARAALPNDERFTALIESMTKADQDDLLQRN